MSADDLRACIVDIGRSLSSSGAVALADAIRACQTPAKLEATSDTLPTPSQQKAAAALARSWSSADVDPEQVAMAIEVAQETAAAEHEAEEVELVWTGPKSPDVAVAMNAEALLELIDGAVESLLLVSAYTWQVPKVVEKLSEAAERGVEISLVLEWHDNKGEPTGFDPVKSLGGPLPDGVAVYQWPVDDRPKQGGSGKVGYLHAKCAVADRQHAFVSSANLTVNALEWNMELGLVVRGGTVPARIVDHFTALISDGVLRRVRVG